GEGVVVRIVVRVGIGPVTEVARVVIVQEVVVTGIAVWVDWRIQRTEIRDERANTWLRGIRAVTVASAAVDTHGRAVVAEPAVAVLDPPIVGARYRIRIFNLVNRTTCPYRLVMRRNPVAVFVLEPA